MLLKNHDVERLDFFYNIIDEIAPLLQRRKTFENDTNTWIKDIYSSQLKWNYRKPISPVNGTFGVENCLKSIVYKVLLHLQSDLYVLSTDAVM